MNVDGVDRRARDLVRNVEPRLPGADQLPVLRILQLDLCRGRDLGGLCGDTAERRGTSARTVGDHAVRRRTFSSRHVPAGGGGRNEHLARGGAGTPQVVLRRGDGAAGAGRHVAPGPIATAVLVRRGELGLYLAPVAFQFFGDQHRQGSKDALTHLRLGDTNDHAVIGLDHDPDRDFRTRLGCAYRPWSERDIETECERAANGGGAGEKGAAAEVRNAAHGDFIPLTRWLAAAWIAARMR